MITLARVDLARLRRMTIALCVALVLGIAGGWVWARANDDSVAVDVVLDQPGEYVEPAEGLEPVPQLAGDPLPDASVSNGDGEVISIASFVGEPLVINFWFSTCVPCAKELADFAEVDAETGGEVRFIGVNPQDSVPVMERFAGERGVTYDLFRDVNAEFQTELGIAFSPYTLFVAPDGTIVDQTGVLDAAGLRTRVARLLELSS